MLLQQERSDQLVRLGRVRVAAVDRQPVITTDEFVVDNLPLAIRSTSRRARNSRLRRSQERPQHRSIAGQLDLQHGQEPEPPFARVLFKNPQVAIKGQTNSQMSGLH